MRTVNTDTNQGNEVRKLNRNIRVTITILAILEAALLVVTVYSWVRK